MKAALKYLLRARGVVVSRPLSMREALGSIPSVSTYTDLDAALDSLLAQETSVGNQAGFASSTARPPSTPSITMYADPTAASDRDAGVKTGRVEQSSHPRDRWC